MAGEDVLGAAVQVLLENLLSHAVCEIKLAFGCEKEITKLQNLLELVKKFMSDAEKKEIDDEAVKIWLQQLEDVAFEADAVLDEFNYQRLKVENQNKVLNILPSGSTDFLFRRKMAHKIKDLNEKFEQIRKIAVETLHLENIVANAPPAASTDGQTNSFTDEPYFIGRGTDVEKIVEGLVTAPPNETFYVVPIFGMGGAGKTTLARKVFKHERINAHFDKTIWVWVPIDSKAEYIFKMILESLTEESVQGSLTEQTILTKIRKHLAEKRYLLVLDDFWSLDLIKWKHFLGSLSGISSETGNGIVLTTRESGVATKLESPYAYQLNKLSEDDCWSIIKAKALSGRRDQDKFEETGRNIAGRCDGLPLAANLIGGFLRGKTEDEWIDLSKSQNLSFGRNENPITKILRLSYDNLPSSSLKRCFAYCSVLPARYLIDRNKMIRLWMAEGFLQGDGRNGMEAVGDNYFEHLLHSSLFQDVKRDDSGNIVHCRMHSFVHELACSILGTRSIHEGKSPSTHMQHVQYVGKSPSTHIQHVRYVGRNSADKYFPSNEQAKCLRTLILNGQISDKFLGFSYLHTLTLSNPDLEELPAGIEKLIHLRFLDLKETRIMRLPGSICKLFNLQTLYAPKFLVEFPNRFTDLIRLRHLVFPPIELPGKERLISLQTSENYRTTSIMAGEAGAAVQALLSNLLSVLYGDIALVFGCRKEFRKLQNSLNKLLHIFLPDAVMKEINQGDVKKWLQQLEDVAFEADNVLDEFNYQLLQNRANNLPSGSTDFIFRRKLARKIKDLNEKLEKINSDAENYGLQMTFALPADNTASARQVDTDSFKPNFVGRENDVERIVEELVTAPPNEPFHVVSIFGMGGAGKTTLAMEVFNHEKIKAHFGETIWVCVPIGFERDETFRMILENLTGESTQNLTGESTQPFAYTILEQILKHLEKKRYLLVLDDIWNEDIPCWYGFFGLLPGISSERGNGVVLTTRKEGVAKLPDKLLNSSYLHQLDKLSVDDCWSIIKEKALSGQSNLGEFEETGRNLARLCDGLPLAASLIGGFLRGKTEDEWIDLSKRQNLSFEDDENPLSKILRLSYDNLPNASIKKCFAYCSILPPNVVIHRDRMIHLWMAEGFLQSDYRHDKEAMGDYYFKHLLESSLFEDVHRDDFGNIVHCSIRNSIHDLACFISGTRSIHEGSSQSFHMQRVRYVGRNSADTYFPLKEQAKCLRTLILNGKISLEFLEFSYLHTLTLSNPDLEELPAGIEKLIHLRFLDLKETRIMRLPGSICKLFNLQTLYAPKFLVEFPNRFTDLICLRHLVFPPVKLPPGMGRLTRLRTLEYYRVGTEKGCTIAELGKLENLKGKLHIAKLEWVKDKIEAERADLFGKKNVYNLVLEWGGARSGETNDENVLEGLQPQPHLKSLEINGYEGKNFPLWTMEMKVRCFDIHSWVKLENLTRIKLTSCRRCKEIPTLGHLPNLKFLELSNLPNVSNIGLSFYCYENSSNTSPISSNISFQALEQLKLLDMPILTDWVDAEGNAAVFPRLSHMEIKSCQQLKSVPCHFACLEELYLEKLSGDFPLSNVCNNTTSLGKLDINELPGLIHLPEGLFDRNVKIWCLKIKSCSSLTHLVPSLLGGGASLRELVIDDCKSLSELPNELDTLDSLLYLELIDLPKLVTFPTEASRNLRKLRIGGYSFTHHLNRLLHHQHHLEDLTLYGKDCDTMSAVDTQHLTILRWLGIHGFGIETLPEWIGNISSLQQLSIWGCKSLKHMPSKEAMQRLTNLSLLQINNCPLMKESFNSSDDDSEWAKVSCIQKIEIDDQSFTRDAPAVQVEEKNPCCFPIPRRNGGVLSPSTSS